MKKVMLFLSVTLCLVCAISSCSKEKKDDRFEKNVPFCIKQYLIENNWIMSANEYCTNEGAKRIYNFLYNSSQPYGTLWRDEQCNLFIVESEEGTLGGELPEGWGLGYLFHDGTIEYRDDIYHFNRIVFTQN